MARKENGKPVLRTANGLPVVALDVSAKLSGISARQVAKVFAALSLLERHSGLTLGELVDLEHAPTAAPDQTRAEGTQAYCAELAQSWHGVHNSEAVNLLNLDRCR